MALEQLIASDMALSGKSPWPEPACGPTNGPALSELGIFHLHPDGSNDLLATVWQFLTG